MLRRKVYATLIIGVALFMFGGIPHVTGETILLKPEFIEVIKPEFMEVSEFEFIEVTKFQFIEINKFEFTEASEPKFSERFIDVDGSTKFGGKQKSLKEIMCAKDPRLLTPEECLFVGQ